MHGLGPAGAEAVPGHIECAGRGARAYGFLEFPLTDGLGSVRAVTDTTGAVTGTADYTAFGATRTSTGAIGRFGYTGEPTDPTTGHTHLRARDLDPTLGRLLSIDTVQPNAPGTQGYNLYAYTANNPTTWTDPTGHLAETPLAPAAARMQASVVTAGIQNARYIPALCQQKRVRICGYLAMALVAQLIHCAIDKACLTKVKANLDAAGDMIGGIGSTILNIDGDPPALPNPQVAPSRETAPPGPGNADERGRHIFMPGSDMPDTTKHNIEAIAAGYKNELHRRTSPRDQHDGWYNKVGVCAGNVAKISGKTCDEYPYLATWEGYDGPNGKNKVSLALVPRKESRTQGGAISGFYSNCGVQKATGEHDPNPEASFIVVPMPATPTTWICSDGRTRGSSR